MPFALGVMVKRLPAVIENCAVERVERTRIFLAPAEAPVTQITANLTFAMVPALADQNDAELEKRYSDADAPAVHVTPVIALPDDEYPFASVNSPVTDPIVESVTVAAFDADV